MYYSSSIAGSLINEISVEFFLLMQGESMLNKLLSAPFLIVSQDLRCFFPLSFFGGGVEVIDNTAVNLSQS